MSQKSYGQEGSAPSSNCSQPQHGKGLSSPALFGGPRTQRASSPAPPITFDSGGHGASILRCQDPSKPAATMSDHNGGPVPPNNGTHESVLSREPFVERDDCVLQVYQTCTFQSPYLTYSLEELRLKDYSQGRRFGTGSSQNLKAPDSLSGVASESYPAPVDVA